MPNYDFTSLSSYDFEVLVRDLLQASLKIRLESFKRGRDGGIDLRYMKTPRSKLIVQCKHFAQSTFSALCSTLRREELPKIQALEPKRYVLATSLGLNPANKAELMAALDPFCRSERDIYGKEDLNNLLGLFPRVEKQHIKLWLTSTEVLSVLCHSAVFNRTESDVEALKKRLLCYVQNESYAKAQTILRRFHYCIIAGCPGIGKTMLADILLSEHIAQGYQPCVISGDVGEAFTVLDRDTPQVFYYDDFLGQTCLEAKFGKNEEKDLLRFIDMVVASKAKRFVLTTREYILNQAKSIYEALEYADWDLAKCVVDLSDYTMADRARILLNHVYFSGLPQAYRMALHDNRNYAQVVRHRNFSPRIVEWMTGRVKHADISSDQYVGEFLSNLDNPLRLWEHAFEHQLHQPARQVMITMAGLPPEVLVDDLERAYSSYVTELSKTYPIKIAPEDFRRALKELDGDFIRINSGTGFTSAVLSNPSIRDYMEHYLRSSPTEFSALCRSAVFFDQCTRLLQIAGFTDQGTDEQLVKYAEVLFPSMASTLERDDCGLVAIRISADSTVTKLRWQSRMKSRAVTIIEAARRAPSPAATALAARALASLATQTAQTEGDREELLDLTKRFIQCKFDIRAYKKEFAEACNLLFATRFRSIDDFRYFAELDQLLPDILAQRRARVHSEFISWVRSEVEFRVRADSMDPSALHKFRDDVRQLESSFPADIAEDLRALRARAFELATARGEQDEECQSEADADGADGDDEEEAPYGLFGEYDDADEDEEPDSDLLETEGDDEEADHEDDEGSSDETEDDQAMSDEELDDIFQELRFGEDRQ